MKKTVVGSKANTCMCMCRMLFSQAGNVAGRMVRLSCTRK